MYGGDDSPVAAQQT